MRWSTAADGQPRRLCPQGDLPRQHLVVARRRREVLTGELVDRPGSGRPHRTRLLVRRALAALTPRQRAVVVLRYFEDLTERDTAEVLGVSVGTVKSQTHLSCAACARPRPSWPSSCTRSPDDRHPATTCCTSPSPTPRCPTRAAPPGEPGARPASPCGGRRGRCRRAALVVGVVGGLALVDRGRSGPGLSTGPRAGASARRLRRPRAPRGRVRRRTSRARRAGHALPGLPVWWSPSLAQEAGLPAYPDSPLPATIDVESEGHPAG